MDFQKTDCQARQLGGQSKTAACDSVAWRPVAVVPRLTVAADVTYVEGRANSSVDFGLHKSIFTQWRSPQWPILKAPSEMLDVSSQQSAATLILANRCKRLRSSK